MKGVKCIKFFPIGAENKFYFQKIEFYFANIKRDIISSLEEESTKHERRQRKKK